jgi:hypothetical protein
MATLAAVTEVSTNDPCAARERHHNEGHGRRLTAAFEALEAYPVLVESRNRVLRLSEGGDPSTFVRLQGMPVGAHEQVCAPLVP